jgi:two-component system response regulator FixJ
VTNLTEQHIFFVDDEPMVRKVVGRTLEQAGFKVSCFSRAADCLQQLRSRPCDLLITDVKKPGMDGMELLTRVKCIIPSLPVLVVSGYGSIQMAVAALKAGASDFIEKPFNRASFLSAVDFALKGNNRPHPLVNKTLTKTEIKILRLILDGKSNKDIARLRNRSVRTIEDQHHHIMHKLGADNSIDLVKQVAVVRLPELLANG